MCEVVRNISFGPFETYIIFNSPKRLSDYVSERVWFLSHNSNIIISCLE